jgi:hypothetical protein
VLKIIEHQQHIPAAQKGRQAVDDGLAAGFPNADGMGNGRRYQLMICDRREGDEVDLAKIASDFRRRL